MLKFLVLVAALAMTGNAFGQPAASQLVMNEDSIGPVRRDWKLADFLSLSLPIERHGAFLETEPLEVFTVRLDGQNEISFSVFVDGDTSFVISTRSLGFATQEGARVGDTLETLRRLYPRGEFSKGLGEAPWLTFEPYGQGTRSMPNLIFEFDTKDIPFECFERDRSCPDFSHLKSQGAAIYAAY